MIKNFSQLSAKVLGFTGECLARDYFAALGYQTFKPTFYHYGDLALTGKKTVYIEVKTIRQGLDGSYSATIRKDKSQSLIHADFILLYVCADKLYPYIIPVSFVPHIKRINITSHPLAYTGKYSQFLNNWQAILESA